MATAETALVTATFMYCFPYHLPGSRQKVEVNKSCAVPLVRSYLVIIYNNNVNKISKPRFVWIIQKCHSSYTSFNKNITNIFKATKCVFFFNCAFVSFLLRHLFGLVNISYNFKPEANIKNTSFIDRHKRVHQRHPRLSSNVSVQQYKGIIQLQL